VQSGIHWGLAIVNSDLSAHGETKHYPILDALRFVLAFWVVMDHFGEFPLFANADTSVPAVWLLSHSHATIVFGIAAVMGFLSFRAFAFIFHSELGRPRCSRYFTRDATFESGFP